MSNTLRGHPVPGVAPAVSIEAFNPNTSPKTLVEPTKHNSVTLNQRAGSANGHAVTSQKLPSHPVAAFNSEGKPTPECPPSWGMGTAPRPHRPGHGDAVLKEAAPCGSVTLAGDVHHSCIDKTLGDAC